MAVLNKLYALKWRNRYSGEEGFVEIVSKKNRCFYNTTSVVFAKKYKTMKTLEKDIATLVEIGEGTNNDFFAVEL